MNENRWRTLTQSLGLPPTPETFQTLQNYYSEKHRHYHTAKHIDDCLEKLDATKHFASEPDEIEVAIWFHDAIYKPFSSKNELRSAAWAQSFLFQHGADNTRAERVYALIMATQHNTSTSSNDSSLLVDIDLSILGVEGNQYRQYENDVRKEYRWVPYFIYRKRRSSILRSFLNRDRIYSIEYFYDHYEKPARVNIQNALSVL